LTGFNNKGLFSLNFAGWKFWRGFQQGFYWAWWKAFNRIGS